MNDDEHAPASFRHKDTKRWCKGRVGIDHQWVERVWLTFPRVIWYLSVCAACGRHGAYRTKVAGS